MLLKRSNLLIRKTMKATFLILIAFLLILTGGCRTAETTIVSASDSVYSRHEAERVRIDSVFIRSIDSIILREKADTVFLERVRLEFRDRYRHDTVTVFDTLRSVRDSIVYIERIRTDESKTAGRKIKGWVVGLVALAMVLGVAYIFYKVKF